MSSSQMMPIVFCASLLPWPMLYIAEDTSCSLRNQRSVCLWVRRRQIQDNATMMIPESSMPRSGATTMKDAVLMMPGASSGPVPAFAIVEPTRPPISACEDEDGRP